MKNIVLFFAFISLSFAEVGFKPFILGYTNQDSIQSNIDKIKDKLKNQDIKILGEYSPYSNAHIIIITDNKMIDNASKSKYGGFGAMIRISITKTKTQTQISYNNPMYLKYIYHLKNKPSLMINKLKNSIGSIKQYGSDKSYSIDELGSYHYKFLMPYFEDVIKIASFDSYEKAILSVRDGLSNNTMGVSVVYEVSIPQNSSSVFGVSMSQESSSDKYIMGEIDFKKLKSTSHLPYEVLVSGKDVYILPAEFRIAINFPELSMMGDNSFMNIMSAPGDIENVLSKSIKK